MSALFTRTMKLPDDPKPGTKDPLITLNRKEELLQMCLAATAGYIDAFGLMKFKTYLSFMSGNTTQSGSLLAKGNFGGMALAATAIVSFTAGIILGNLIKHLNGYQERWMGYMVVAGGLLSYLIADRSCGIATVPAVAILALSVGLMNTLAGKVGRQAVNPDFVTGTLTNMAWHWADAMLSTYPSDSEGTWDTHKRRAALLLMIWLCFIAGAMLATVAFSSMGTWAMTVPIVGLLLIPVQKFNQGGNLLRATGSLRIIL